MTKSELVKKLSAQFKVSLTEVEILLEAILVLITTSLGERDSVKLTNFGTFSPVDLPAKTINGFSGKVNVPPAVSVSFRPAGALKDALNPQRRGG